MILMRKVKHLFKKSPKPPWTECHRCHSDLSSQAGKGHLFPLLLGMWVAKNLLAECLSSNCPWPKQVTSPMFGLTSQKQLPSNGWLMHEYKGLASLPQFGTSLKDPLSSKPPHMIFRGSIAINYIMVPLLPLLNPTSPLPSGFLPESTTQSTSYPSLPSNPYKICFPSTSLFVLLYSLPCSCSRPLVFWLFLRGTRQTLTSEHFHSGLPLPGILQKYLTLPLSFSSTCSKCTLF